MAVALIHRVANYTRDRIFKKIHKSNLIYNACWEDPRIDRQIMNINGSSKIVMITSAGCNALDYTLDEPEAIHTIDVNSRQNALLELKRSVYRKATYEDLFAMFGDGYHPGVRKLYKSLLRPDLPEYAREFWDQKLKYFEGQGVKKSFYFYGTSGNFAWFFYRYLKAHGRLNKRVNRLFEAKSLKEQEEIYDEIEPALWNFMVRWIMRRHITMALLGVPRPQRELIINEFPGGILNYLRTSMRDVFTKIPISDNYFWHAYIRGYYTESCSPEYLKKENFEKLKNLQQRIHQHTSTISEFLENHPDEYTHYVLLDHQDWLAWYDVEALHHEWELILKNSKPGTVIILRSAALRVDFLPEFVKSRLRFRTDLSEKFHNLDRVGTYGSLMVAEVLEQV